MITSVLYCCGEAGTRQHEFPFEAEEDTFWLELHFFMEKLVADGYFPESIEVDYPDGTRYLHFEQVDVDDF